ncbi:MAG: hypothetical protein KGJ98_00215 [Chloroflexota bacterium]|nr:hypothetical protein [Chloroflexota bacterium]
MSDHRVLGDVERERLARLADAILPAYGPMPSASAVGVSGPLLDRALSILPSVDGVLARVLARPADDPRAVVEDLRSRDAAGFRTLVLVVAATYYLSPEVRDALGYQGQEALRIDPFELPGYLEDGSLERVIARGPLYRDPESGAPA